jgi:hypothetical protein
MKAIVVVRDKSGCQIRAVNAEFVAAEWERLKKDWLEYLDVGGPRGGAYRYTDRSERGAQEQEMLLRFEDVAAIC